jgi:tRNA threonylcarbamoyladenosine biosynthesis protein TsaE
MPPASCFRISTDSAAATCTCGEALAPLLEPDDVIALTGDLGAGKTQLTKGIAIGLGVPDPVTSPTFNILLVHDGDALVLNHIDLYRLDRAEQLEDLDYFGTLESGGVSVVEWGDRFAEAIPADCVIVRLHITGDETREIEIEGRGSRGERLASAWASACSAGAA